MKKIFAHRFKWSHERRRRVLRRKLREGKIVLLERRKEGWLYGIPSDYEPEFSQLKLNDR